MSASLVSTVLNLEKQAEEILRAAAAEAQAKRDDVKTECAAATQKAKVTLEDELKKREAAAVQERERALAVIVQETETSLKAVKGIPQATLDKGVKYLLKQLSPAE